MVERRQGKLSLRIFHSHADSPEREMPDSVDPAGLIFFFSPSVPRGSCRMDGLIIREIVIRQMSLRKSPEDDGFTILRALIARDYATRRRCLSLAIA